MPTEQSALLVVDVQNDFCPGGALAVADGDRVVAALNRYLASRPAGLPVFASRDWHPAATTHFTTSGGPWPPHCVQGTPGAAFRPGLRLSDDTIVVTKGDDPDAPGYSAFDGRDGEGTSLAASLETRGVTHLYVGGLATDYCVKHSVLDALAAGLRVTVLEDAIAGVEATPGDVRRATEAMRSRGARFVRGGRLL